ncbi:response regulator transcription factor [Ferrimonas sediminicola]|uniref:Response regulator transcription factor n=1 Tax=Ferrimonas sediminicola TaxID=2569538 RepID=A0A4U1BCH3_9GAMM|nr:response regulator transcription factor [Ferrimonas sediminicola]TKB48387.1 response regulator transcription factor [Ferrimonas sediminicola]
MDCLKDAKLLLVEDNREIAGILFDFFEAKEVELDYADNGELGLKLALDSSFDAIILDLMLPRMDGFEVCQALRSQGKDTPVLMLTALDNRRDTLQGFKQGADDYLTKPFDLEILEARLLALISRYRGTVTTGKLQVGELEIDTKTRQAWRQGRKLCVNPTTFKILSVLAHAAPGVVSREQLTDAIWGDQPPSNDVLRSHIYQLRSQLDKPFTKPMLVTVPKVGLRLELKP